MIGGFFILADVIQVTVSGLVIVQLGAMVKGCEVTLSFNPIFHSRPIGSSIFWQLILKIKEASCLANRPFPVAYPGIFFFWGGVQQIQLRTEDRENGDLGAVAP